MEKKFEHQERKGLPGGPNEMFTYTTGVFSTDAFSTEGYKRNSPDVNNPYNIIPSGNITMEDVDFPVHGVDNLGNEQMMTPGNDYQFPGDMVFETPMYKRGGGLLTKTMKCNNCSWEWKAADGGNDVSTCHKCGSQALPMAQRGGTTSDSLALYNNAMEKYNFYKNNTDYSKAASGTSNSDIPDLLNEVKNNKDHYNERARELWDQEINYNIGSQEDRFYTNGNITSFGDIRDGSPNSVYMNDAPNILLHKNIKPKTWMRYENAEDQSDVPLYDPVEIWPKSMGDVPKEAFDYSYTHTSDIPPPHQRDYVLESERAPSGISRDNLKENMKLLGIGTNVPDGYTLIGYTSDGGPVYKPSEPSEPYVPNYDTDLSASLKTKGRDRTYAARKKLAEQAGITDYKGTAEQNIAILKAEQARGFDETKPLVVKGYGNNAETPTTQTQTVPAVIPAQDTASSAQTSNTVVKPNVNTPPVQTNRQDQVQYRRVLKGYKINPRTGEKEPVYEEQGYRARGPEIGKHTTIQNNFKYGGVPKAQGGVETTEPWRIKPAIDPAMFVAAAKEFAANERKKQLTGAALEAHKRNPQLLAREQRDRDIETLKGSGINPARLPMPSKDEGEVRKSVDTHWGNSLGNYLANPMTSLGYLARGQQMPNLVQDKDNPIDMALETINPFAWGDYGMKAIDDLSEGNFVGAGLNALGAIPAVPAAVANAKNITRVVNKIPAKINPNYFTPNSNMYYRGLGKEGVEDALQSGVFRPNQNVKPNITGGFDLAKDFNTTQVGTYYSPNFNIADKYGKGFIAEVPRDAATFGKRYKGSDWSMATKDQIPIDKGRILEKNWWSGYKPVEVPKQLPGSPNAVFSADDVVKAGFDGNFLTRPLTPFTKNELTKGEHLYRKIGGKKGLQDLIDKGGAQAPAPMRMNSGLTVDTPFFGIGKKPLESYSGTFAVETPLPSMSKYNWSSRVGGTSNYGVAPFDKNTGALIKNIPLEDLEVFRKKWLSNNYRKLDKNNLQKELKSANLQELSEKLYKWGIRGYVADQILNDGDLTGGNAIKIIENYIEYKYGGEPKAKFGDEVKDYAPFASKQAYEEYWSKNGGIPNEKEKGKPKVEKPWENIGSNYNEIFKEATRLLIEEKKKENKKNLSPKVAKMNEQSIAYKELMANKKTREEIEEYKKQRILEEQNINPSTGATYSQDIDNTRAATIQNIPEYKMPSKDEGSIDQYVEPEFREQALNYLANPMTTLGYLARGQDLPNFVQDKGNVIDNAMDVINPFAYLDYANKASENLDSGEYSEAGFNLLAAIPFLPKGGKAFAFKEPFIENTKLFLKGDIKQELQQLRKQILKKQDELFELSPNLEQSKYWLEKNHPKLHSKKTEIFKKQRELKDYFKENSSYAKEGIKQLNYLNKRKRDIEGKLNKIQQFELMDNSLRVKNTNSLLDLNTGQGSILNFKTGEKVKSAVYTPFETVNFSLKNKNKIEKFNTTEPKLIDENYLNTVNDNISFIENVIPGSFVFGSSKLLTSAKLPHLIGDFDIMMSKSNYEKFAKNNPGSFNGSSMKHKIPGAASNVDPIDVVIIDEYKGKAKGERATELFRQFDPDNYYKEVQNSLKNKTEVEIPYSANELLNKVDFEIKSVMDAYESIKDKHINRIDALINYGDPDVVLKGQKQYVKSLLGKDGAIGHKFSESSLSNVNDNIKTLEKINFIGDKKLVAKNPKKMQLAINDYFINNTILTRYVRANKLKNIESALKEYKPDFGGGAALGIGQNHVTLGDSYFIGNVLGIKQIKLNNLNTQNPLDYVSSIEDQISGTKLFSKDEKIKLNKILNDSSMKLKNDKFLSTDDSSINMTDLIKELPYSNEGKKVLYDFAKATNRSMVRTPANYGNSDFAVTLRDFDEQFDKLKYIGVQNVKLSIKSKKLRFDKNERQLSSQQLNSVNDYSISLPSEYLEYENILKKGLQKIKNKLIKDRQEYDNIQKSLAEKFNKYKNKKIPYLKETQKELDQLFLEQKNKYNATRENIVAIEKKMAELRTFKEKTKMALAVTAAGGLVTGLTTALVMGADADDEEDVIKRFPDFNTKDDVYNTYKDYINGSYEEQDAKKAEYVYDKLNRLYYKKARKNNMSTPNYIMTNVIR